MFFFILLQSSDAICQTQSRPSICSDWKWFLSSLLTIKCWSEEGCWEGRPSCGMLLCCWGVTVKLLNQTWCISTQSAKPQQMVFYEWDISVFYSHYICKHFHLMSCYEFQYGLMSKKRPSLLCGLYRQTIRKVTFLNVLICLSLCFPQCKQFSVFSDQWY